MLRWADSSPRSKRLNRSRFRPARKNSICNLLIMPKVLGRNHISTAFPSKMVAARVILSYGDSPSSKDFRTYDEAIRIGRPSGRRLPVTEMPNFEPGGNASKGRTGVKMKTRSWKRLRTGLLVHKYFHVSRSLTSVIFPIGILFLMLTRSGAEKPAVHGGKGQGTRSDRAMLRRKGRLTQIW